MSEKLSNTQIKSYQPAQIIFPTIHCYFKRSSIESDNVHLFYKIEINIINDNLIEVFLGILVRAGTDFINDTNSFKNEFYYIRVDSSCVFTVDGIIPKITKATDMPIIANMTATIYPFLKEKVSYLLNSNFHTYYLPSFNVMDFIFRNVESIKVTDQRNVLLDS